jgi:hypothetical protein
MHLDKKQILQRLFLAFTTGLFLACAARVSSAEGAMVPTATTMSVAR